MYYISYLIFFFSKKESCVHFPDAAFSVELSSCVDGQCGEFGNCKEYISGVHVFSTCACIAGKTSTCINQRMSIDNIGAASWENQQCGFLTGLTQTGLCSNRKQLEA